MVKQFTLMSCNCQTDLYISKLDTYMCENSKKYLSHHANNHLILAGAFNKIHQFPLFSLLFMYNKTSFL